MIARTAQPIRRAEHAERFMAEALRLATRGGRAVSPNPLVGAVLVKDGRIVAHGYHRRFGGAHAEVECLSKYAGPLTRTTLYVTLEPCSHFGKTPPCAALLASTPIPRIVVAMKDPNPLVAGEGIRFLRRAGKKVEVGVLHGKAEKLNRRYIRAIKRKRPYVHVKVAQTLDGRISDGSKSGDERRWITGAGSRRLVHAMRADYDAVLVGARTVAVDDPRLNVRGIKGRDPDVVVLDGRLRISESARLFRVGRGRRVFVCATNAACRENGRKVERLSRRGVIVLAFPGRKGKISLANLLARLYAEGIGSLLVEGGGEVFGHFAAEECIDELSLFVTPRFSRGGQFAFGEGSCWVDAAGRMASELEVRQVGRDVLLHAFFD
ncbi:MAG: bifunctional diaminohydroxyphosphoribosylaminopyrimidine [Bacteroidetes bacterium]|nr:bifunctional diaminohydroxyphosphoribosylaminopyrimidine [Bacteroidota bacterium]